MNNYIILDGYKYATVANNWNPIKDKPSTVRYTLSGNLDITYSSASPVSWEGEIAGPVTARDVDWGTIDTLRASLAKKVALDYQDHYGDTYTVHSVAEEKQRSLMPVWDDPNNVIYIQVQLVMESEVVV